MFRFEEHDIYIPMIVLEELDAGKKGLSEAARNVRQVSRFLDELMAERDQGSRSIAGSSCRRRSTATAARSRRPAGSSSRRSSSTAGLPDNLPGHGADNAILGYTLALQKEQPRTRVTLVSKDINLRIKAAIIGVHAEDYYSDKTIEDADLLYTGMQRAAGQLLGTHGKQPRVLARAGTHVLPRARQGRGRLAAEPVRVPDRTNKASRRSCAGSTATSAVLEVVRDFRSERHGVWGITARNREQNFALNLLLDPEIDFVTILGPAGTGKTLLTLAAGLAQTLETNRFNEIIMTRVTIPLGEDIGFLPGTEEEKMEPWMGALMDNLEVLTQSQEGGSWGRAATNDLLRNRIKIRSLNFMRGRTFLNRYIILDEAQNLTPKQMKALVTRAGPGHQARLPRQHRPDRHART